MDGKYTKMFYVDGISVARTLVTRRATALRQAVHKVYKEARLLSHPTSFCEQNKCLNKTCQFLEVAKTIFYA